MGSFAYLKEWLIGRPYNQVQGTLPQEYSLNVLKPPSDAKSFRVPPLSSNDATIKAADESARRLARITKGLDIPFTLLTEPFALDDIETSWAESQLAASSLSLSDYPEDVQVKLMETFGVEPGLWKAAEAKYQWGDFTGALTSWVKAVSMHLKRSATVRWARVEYLDKERWLLLAKIYGGMNRIDDASTALTWARSAADTEQAAAYMDPSVEEHLGSDWRNRFNDVLENVKKLEA